MIMTLQLLLEQVRIKIK